MMVPVITPLLSVIVPAYNAAPWLERCMGSLESDDGQVEVLVVDDGSADDTLAIAQAWARTHQGVRVIHQENKGHGGAVNTGLAAATGTWVKVCDADDALSPAALAALVDSLGRWRRAGTEPDLVVTNFVYVRDGSHAWSQGGRRRLGVPRLTRSRHAVRYSRLLPKECIGTWEDVGRFRPDQYLMMHALTYRRQVLQEAGLTLPEHCFYVDNLYAFEPLAQVRTLTYLDLDLYLYTVGRDGQSVADEVIVKRLDQHDRVNALMLEAMPHEGEVPTALLRYLTHYYTISCVVITTLALRSGTPENLRIRTRLWERLAASRPDVDRRVRRSFLGRAMTLPGRMGERIPVYGYQVARRLLALN